MSRDRVRICVVAAVVAVATPGCGLGPGESTNGDGSLTVTRDYGAESLLEAQVSEPKESETVMKLLDREATIETLYGGGFVQSIEGIEGGFTDDRSYDWFFYVNGVESEVGAAEVPVRGGDRIWWDHRDWTSAMRVPAVVGSWPEPFLQASAGAARDPVRIDCAGDRSPCDVAADKLAEAGVNAEIATAGDAESSDAPRVVVGPWAEISSDPAARLLEKDPASSGVFARFEAGGLELLDERATGVLEAEGLVAATRDGRSAPTWLVTGIDPEGVAAAVELLDDEILRDRYAVASVDGEPVALPVPGDAP